MSAIFKDVPFLENVKINTDGSIVLVDGSPKPIGSDIRGYKRISIKGKDYRIHKLVYRTFVFDNNRRVKFLDKNQLNTHFSNLAPRPVNQYLNDSLPIGYFKSSPTFPDMQVSVDGGIIVQDGIWLNVCHISPSKQYFQVSARCSDNSFKAVYVHKIVADTFLGEKKQDQIIFHLDGDSTNNHYKNLAYLSKSEARQKTDSNRLRKSK